LQNIIDHLQATFTMYRQDGFVKQYAFDPPNKPPPSFNTHESSQGEIPYYFNTELYTVPPSLVTICHPLVIQLCP